MAPLLDLDFRWPTDTEVQKLQMKAKDAGEKTPILTRERGLYVTSSKAVWIPETEIRMQLRICVIVHCGRGGHRGADTTYGMIKQYFFWRTMRGDIKNFCDSCLHCLSTIGGTRVLRPLSNAMHATKSNEMIHFDFSLYGTKQLRKVFRIACKG